MITNFSSIVKNVLFVSDLHEPYSHKDAPDFLYAVAEKTNPDLIVCVGDEVDYHALSRYEKDPDLYSGGYEFAESFKRLYALEKLFPRMQLIQSNHGARYVKAATMKAGIPRAMLKSEQELYEKEHWIWHQSLILKTPVGNIYVTHGAAPDVVKYATQSGLSTVQGHFHNILAAGWVNTRTQYLFGMTVGCLADSTSYALAYAKEEKFAQVLGCGVLINGEPQVVRMELNKIGRWSKKIKCFR